MRIKETIAPALVTKELGSATSSKSGLILETMVKSVMLPKAPGNYKQQNFCCIDTYRIQRVFLHLERETLTECCMSAQR